MDINKPDKIKKFSDATAKLYVGTAQVNDGVGDWMIVDNFKGNQDEVIVFDHEGKKTVARVRHGFKLTAGSTPAVPVSGQDMQWLEPVTEDDSKRLLGIYDSMKEG